MKKLLTLIILVMIIGNGQKYGQALSGTYYIGDPGTKPGGGDPEYASLKAACDDINSKGLSNNVSFYITSNLTENTNVTLGINSEYEILFKPAPTVTPTVTYTQSADNSGTSGAFVIGHAMLKTGSIWLAAFMHAIIDQTANYFMGVIYTPTDPIFSFGIGLYGMATLAVVVFFLLRDPVWKDDPAPVLISQPEAI